MKIILLGIIILLRLKNISTESSLPILTTLKNSKVIADNVNETTTATITTITKNDAKNVAINDNEDDEADYQEVIENLNNITAPAAWKRPRRDPPGGGKRKHRTRYLKRHPKPTGRRRVKKPKHRHRPLPTSYSYAEPPEIYYAHKQYEHIYDSDSYPFKGETFDIHEFQKNFDSDYNIQSFELSEYESQPMELDFYSGREGRNRKGSKRTRKPQLLKWENQSNLKKSYPSSRTYSGSTGDITIQSTQPQLLWEQQLPEQEPANRPRKPHQMYGTPSGEDFQKPVQRPQEFSTPPPKDYFQLPIQGNYQTVKQENFKPPHEIYNPPPPETYKPEVSITYDSSQPVSYNPPPQISSYSPPPRETYNPPPQEKYAPPPQEAFNPNPQMAYNPPETYNPPTYNMPIQTKNSATKPYSIPPEVAYNPPTQENYRPATPEIYKPPPTFKPSVQQQDIYRPRDVYTPTKQNTPPPPKEIYTPPPPPPPQEIYTQPPPPPSTHNTGLVPPTIYDPSVDWIQNTSHDLSTIPHSTNSDSNHGNTFTSPNANFSNSYFEESFHKFDDFTEPGSQANLPLDDDHKYPSYDFPKTSYEVPIYNFVPFNSALPPKPPDNVKPTLTSPTKRKSVKPNFEIKVSANNSTFSTSLEELIEPPADYLDDISNTKQPRRNPKRGRDPLRKHHILDTDELREAFSSNIKSEHIHRSSSDISKISKRAPDNYVLASSANGDETTEIVQSYSWEPTKLQKHENLKQNKRNAKQVKDFQIISIQKSKSRSFLNGTMSPLDNDSVGNYDEFLKLSRVKLEKATNDIQNRRYSRNFSTDENINLENFK